MSNTKIEWTDKSWNPIIGCTKVSAGCKNCYAERMTFRVYNMLFRGKYSGKAEAYGRVLNWDKSKGKIGTFNGNVTLADYPNLITDGKYSQKVQFESLEGRLEQPLHWKKPSKIFVCSMSDLFHPDVPDDFINKVFAVMGNCQRHTFQVLTKRPKRMWQYVQQYHEWLKHAKQTNYWERYPNVQLGVSISNQDDADKNVPIILQIPAAVRWVSIEPMLGEVNLKKIKLISSKTTEETYMGFRTCENKLDWVVVGGESGLGARPMHPDWVRKVRDDCKSAGVPFYFKQWGEWKPVTEYEHIVYLQKTKIHITPDADNKYYTKGEFIKTGKKKAGCMLDGVEYKEYPK